MTLIDLFASELACPDCPTQRAARALFFSDVDTWRRLLGLLAPFVVTGAALALFVGKLQRYARRLAARNAQAREAGGAA